MVLGRYSITNILKRTGYFYLVSLLFGYVFMFAIMQARAVSLNASYENDTGYESVSWCGGGYADYRTYCRRNCTSYVAYKLAAAGVSAAHYMHNGNGKDWDDSARAKGIAVGSTAKVGAVAYWNSGGGGYGHVGWVDTVNADGSVNTSNYNGLTGEFYTQTAVKAEGYIYFSNTTSPVGSVGTASFIGTDTLAVGKALKLNQYILSSDVRSVLILQKDGNLVLYQNGYKARWNTGTTGQSISQLVMQGDGNLVLYRTDGKAAWHSNTQGRSGVRLSLQSDGNLVVYSSTNSPVWNAGTTLSTPAAKFISTDRLPAGKTLYKNQYIRSSDKRYVLVFQSDGNLVLMTPGGKPIWNSATSGKGGTRLVLQGDGNLVVYNDSGIAVWNIGKFASNPYLVMQSDGNLVSYNGAGQSYWSSGTRGKI